MASTQDLPRTSSRTTDAELGEHQLRELETREIVMLLYQKVIIIQKSLKKCQSRCHVDNPPGRWLGLCRAVAALFRPRSQLITMENADVE